jgi:hypothetical protein
LRFSVALSSARCCSAWQRLVFLPDPQISLAELEPCTELIKRTNLSPAPLFAEQEKNRAKRQAKRSFALFFIFLFFRFFGFREPCATRLLRFIHGQISCYTRTNFLLYTDKFPVINGQISC